MIIDAHCHLGFDEIFDEDFTEADLLKSQEKNGIDTSLVQPAVVHDLETVRKYHDDIGRLAAAHPGKFLGIANPDPHLPGTGYEGEVRRCIRELGFSGIKLHPLGHAVNPTGRHGRRVFEIAAALGVPVLVHTGVGIPWSSPGLLDEAAERHPGLPIILCHAGGLFATEAAQVVRRHPNVFLELSWQGNFVIKNWVGTIGADRLMFGSDHASNAAAELAKIRLLALEPGEEEMILSGTARKVFRI